MASEPVTIFHNPRCSTSNHAMAVADELGIAHETVLYLKDPPDETTLRAVIAKLEDPVTDLVRRDANWERSGLADADVQTEDQVVAVLLAQPELMQRPVIVKGDRAIIGRPKERVRELLG